MILKENGFVLLGAVHFLLEVASSEFPFGLGGVELSSIAVLVATLFSLTIFFQRRHSAATKQVAKISTLLARLNQVANSFQEGGELLSKVCDLAISEGSFKFAAVFEADGDIEGSVADSPLCVAGKSPNNSIELARPLATQALEFGKPLFSSFNSPQHGRLSDIYHKFFDRQSVISLPLNGYFERPSVLILVAGGWGIPFPANQLVKELTLELANDLMRASQRIGLIKRDLEISALNESLLGSLGVGINVVRYPERIIEIANERLLEIAGAKDLDEFISTPARDFYSDDREFERVGELAKEVQSSGYGKVSRVAYRKLNGDPVYLDMSGRLLDLGDGLVRIVWTQIDVTDRVESDRQRSQLSHLRDVLLNNTVAGIDLVEYPARRIIEANLAFAEMMGYESVSEIIGLNTPVLYTVDSEDERMRSLSSWIFQNGEGGIRDLQAVKRDGSIIYLDIHGRLLQEGASEENIIVWTSVDVTERHQLNDELRRSANYDSLTNLPNRRALHEYLEEALTRVRDTGSAIAVGVIDLDDFKPINDAYGHPAGDQLLVEFARRLKDLLRAGDFASRLGGDEFTLVLEVTDFMTVESQLEAIFDRVHKAVEEPFEVGGSFLVTVGMSMGVAVSGIGVDEPDALIRMADSAMYFAKRVKGDRDKWWMIADSDRSEGIFSKLADVADNGIASLTAGFGDFISPSIQPFVYDCCAELIASGILSKNFAELPESYLDDLRDIQIQTLHSIVDPRSGGELSNLSRQLGTIHAYIGTSSSGLVEITNRIRDFIESVLGRVTITSIDRLLLQSSIQERLKLNLRIELEAMERSVDRYTASLSRPMPKAGSSWFDSFNEEVKLLAQLPGVLGCQLWRQNLEGVFYPEINEGEISDSIEEIVRRSTTPRLDSRASTGTGLVTVAMLTGEIVQSNAYSDDPRTSPWHELLVPRGVKSVVAIPVSNQGSHSGVLVLHGSFPNQFASKWCNSFLVELRARLTHILRGVDEGIVNPSSGGSEPYRRLLYSGSLLMYGQPIVDVTTGRLVKVEMLARILRPDGTVATPDKFLPSFNEADLDTLFIQGLEKTLAQMQEWDRAGLDICASLNIAPSTVMNFKSRIWIQEYLERYEIDPGRLTLELIENQELSGEVHTAAVHALSKIGVKLAIDDLGSGYSSLKRLASLPFDIIKIDQSIIRALKNDPMSNLSLVKTMIQIGDDFDRVVIVEGVESGEEIEAVNILGAHYMQGFGIARPMALSDIANWKPQKSLQIVSSGEVSSLLGALAYHMSYPSATGPMGETDVHSCPVTNYLESIGYSGGEESMWHSAIHDGQADPSSKRLANKRFSKWIGSLIESGIS